MASKAGDEQKAITALRGMFSLHGMEHVLLTPPACRCSKDPTLHVGTNRKILDAGSGRRRRRPGAALPFDLWQGRAGQGELRQGAGPVDAEVRRERTYEISSDCSPASLIPWTIEDGRIDQPEQARL